MKVKRLVMTAVFTALVFVTTAYILHIPIPATGGYVHIGDAVIYLAAACLPLPYAIFTASVGAGAFRPRLRNSHNHNQGDTGVVFYK